VLEIREVIGERVLELGRLRASASEDSVSALFGLAGPPRAGELLALGGALFLGTAPDRCLHISSEQNSPSLQSELTKAAAVFSIAVDASDTWTQLAIEGSASLDLLAKGCTLDLHPSVFSEGRCAVTRFAQVRCVLFRSGTSFRLMIGRSYAHSLAEWLVEAAQEFGSNHWKKAPEEASSSATASSITAS
jgi:sarcosine oxidase subunit gamma